MSSQHAVQRLVFHGLALILMERKTARWGSPCARSRCPILRCEALFFSACCIRCSAPLVQCSSHSKTLPEITLLKFRYRTPLVPSVLSSRQNDHFERNHVLGSLVTLEFLVSDCAPVWAASVGAVHDHGYHKNHTAQREVEAVAYPGIRLEQLP